MAKNRVLQRQAQKKLNQAAKKVAREGADSTQSARAIIQQPQQRIPDMSPQRSLAIIQNQLESAQNVFAVNGFNPYIQTNIGKGHVEKTITDAHYINKLFGKGTANKIINSVPMQTFDNKTGLKSFVSGFGEEGAQYQGGRISRAAQNAGYFKKGADGKIEEYNASKIALGFMGASAAGRIVTGGGLYKDAQGNTNLIGVPLV